MKPSTLVLTLAALVPAGCGSSTPDGSEARAVLAAEIAQHAGGKVSLASFEEQDTQKGEILGLEVVSVGFTAELAFAEDGFWVLGGEHAGLALGATETWPSERVARGETRTITGSVDFARTDAGWEPKVDLDLPAAGAARAAGAPPAAARQPSALDLEARAFVLATLEEHWTKGPDGWTTQLQQRAMNGQILPELPDTPFRQIRALEFTLAPESLTEAQKLAGADYRAGVTFERSAERFFHRVKSWDGVKGWAQWKDASPGGIAVERRNGKWLKSADQLFEGIKPTESVPASN